MFVRVILFCVLIFGGCNTDTNGKPNAKLSDSAVSELSTAQDSSEKVTAQYPSGPGKRIISVTINPEKELIQMFWKDSNGVNLKTLSALNAYVIRKQQRLALQ